MATTVQEARPQPVTRYKIRTGMFAWMLHRLTGVALVGYLVIHVWGLRSITNPDAYNALIAGYHAPIFKLGEFLLLGAVAWHALNGLRIVLIDFLGWSPNQKRLFWTLGFVGLVLFAVGGYPSIAALVAHFGSLSVVRGPWSVVGCPTTDNRPLTTDHVQNLRPHRPEQRAPVVRPPDHGDVPRLPPHHPLLGAALRPDDAERHALGDHGRRGRARRAPHVLGRGPRGRARAARADARRAGPPARHPRGRHGGRARGADGGAARRRHAGGHPLRRPHAPPRRPRLRRALEGLQPAVPPVRPPPRLLRPQQHPHRLHPQRHGPRDGRHALVDPRPRPLPRRRLLGRCRRPERLRSKVEGRASPAFDLRHSTLNPHALHPRRRHRRGRRGRPDGGALRARGRRRRRRRLEAPPAPEPHRRGAGRHRRRSPQRGGGPLALARHRHRQELRLPRQPGRHRDDVPRRPAHHHRARALRRPLLPHQGGEDRA